MITPVKYERNPFHVEAIQVSPDNLHEVAEWCGGSVRIVAEDNPTSPAGAYYIKVQVKRPLSARQTKAFVTDWVLSAGTGFKVYTDAAFKKSFSPWIPFETELDTLNEGDTSEQALFHSKFAAEKLPHPILFEDVK